VIALDPEIPLASQRVVFRGARGQWLLDGQPIGQGTRIEWLPRPGRHLLERRDAAAPAIVDRVDFEVRATPAPTGRPAARAGTAARRSRG
jgi:penicillin-binding protein 1C